MQSVLIENTFDAWRATARALLAADVCPADVVWADRSTGEQLMFSPPTEPIPTGQPAPRVPSDFIDLAKAVACHRDAARWGLLYRVLFRLTHGEHELLHIATDDDVAQLAAMEKSVRRDAHKMTAFVRFRQIQTPDGERYIAWHRPDHFIVRRVTPFFVDRFRSMHWTILTPDESVTWDGHHTDFGPGVPRDPIQGDDLQQLWTTYYANIFNPARIKLNAMRAEMPKKHWPTLPETAMIPQMLREAPNRVEQMLKHAPKDKPADDYVPHTHSLTVLRKAAEHCTACDLCKHATQTVFGLGPEDARMVFVGEQPGDEEDLRGEPFVGPAGRLLNEVLDEVGIDRSRVYVTNAVKHFKFEPRGKRRIHAKPNAREMSACRPWLLKELEIIKPPLLVLLGSTAAQTLMGRQFRVTQSRGEWFESDWSRQTLATIHPSAVLRGVDRDMVARNRAMFTEDLRKVAHAFAKAG
ncbi:MAG: UdgX family uracil-DNA binding protein [Tepidisphaeraceae bacterium]